MGAACTASVELCSPSSSSRSHKKQYKSTTSFKRVMGARAGASLLQIHLGHTCRSFEQLLATAHLHQVAQLRRLHQLRKANEAQAALMTKLRAKSAQEEAHAAATEKHRREMSNLQKTRNAELEVRMG